MRNLSGSERIFFAKRLSFLLRAGIPLHGALRTLVRQSKPSLKPMFEALAESADRGQGISAGMSSFPKSFPEYIVQMFSAGEESGTLAEHCALVCAELERRKNVSRKLAGSLLYPVIVAFGTVALSFFLVLVIFPKVKKLFQGLRVPLPLTTRILIWLSDFLRSYGFLMLGLVIALFIFCIYVLRKYPRAREEKDRLTLRAPIVGRMISQYSLATAFRTAGIMLKSGIPIEKSLRYAGASISNLAYRQAFETISKDVTAGNSFSLSLKKFPKLFPETSVSMIEIGESAGTLSDTLSYLSAMIDEENEDVSKALLSIVEPALMAVMGLVVGFIALSIITPIYAITQNISR